jgi:hypothetical protein
MINTLEFKQSGHLNPALSDPKTKALNADKLIGRWVNTNRETQGIAECVIVQDADRFSVSLVGVGADGSINWPTTTAHALANLEEEAGQRTIALAATFDCGFMTAETYIRINKGVLVIVLFNSFRDGSGRSNYVNREFFCRSGLVLDRTDADPTSHRENATRG